MRTKRACSISIWLRVPSFFQKYSPLCKLFLQFYLKPFNIPFLIRSHSLLDQKINNILSVSHDQVVLNSVQSIIQNMLASEDPSQQQLHFLQSCGFGGLWRFAGPFTKVSFVNFNQLPTSKFSFLFCCPCSTT